MFEKVTKKIDSHRILGFCAIIIIAGGNGNIGQQLQTSAVADQEGPRRSGPPPRSPVETSQKDGHHTVICSPSSDKFLDLLLPCCLAVTVLL